MRINPPPKVKPQIVLANALKGIQENPRGDLREFKGIPGHIKGIYRGQKINANFLCSKFFDNPSGHGRPRRKLWTSTPKSAFSCGPGGGEKLFDPRASLRLSYKIQCQEAAVTVFTVLTVSAVVAVSVVSATPP